MRPREADEAQGMAASVTSVTSATGINAASYTYTIDGLLGSMTDQLGRMTSFVYDAGGRLAQRISPDPDGTGAVLASPVQYTRDALGNIIATSDSAGETTHSCSTRGSARSVRPIRRVSPPNTYDVFGNLLSVRKLPRRFHGELKDRAFVDYLNAFLGLRI